jgi:hypothetical protein
MHIKGSADTVLSRATSVAQAANSRDFGADRAILIFTGDVAFSGQDAQYDVATAFIRSVSELLNTPPVLVVVPGNHDCDFGIDLGARNDGIDALQEKPDDPVEPSVVAQCVAVQQSFFRFRDNMASHYLEHNSGHLYYEYSIPVGNEIVGIRCYNTAWVSQLNETPGSLIFPLSALPAACRADFAISAFHHPYNWLTPTSGRAFRRAVEARSDLVLTGHEHDHERYSAYRHEIAKRTSYIEGSALQDSDDPDVSAFNVILIDTKECKQQFHHFVWKANSYSPLSKSDNWEPIELPAKKARGTFEIQPEFRAWLDDSGIPSINKAGKRRTFGDIFVFPHLVEAFQEATLHRKRQTIKSGDVFRALQQYSVVFISAPPKSGRTSFAKQLYVEYSNVESVPLYIDAGEGGLRDSDGLPPAVIRQIRSQYGVEAIERFRQLEPVHRVLIIDNIDKSKLRTESILSLISSLSSFASHVIVIGDDTAGRVSEIAPIVGAQNDDRKAFELQPLSSGLRERLARRWLEADGGASLGEQEETQFLERIKRTLDTIIGRNYVPAFPIYILAVLQAFERGSSVDMHASTHGYFYEILIRLALAGGTAGAANADFNIRLAFLIHVAAEMFEARKTYLLEEELKASFDRYQERYDVGGLEYRSLIDALINRGMLVESGDSVRFQYPYLYYYFVASYLNRDISKQHARDHIERLAKSMDDEEAADILLFLAHLSNDPFIIDKLLEAANGCYADVVPADLDSFSMDTPSDMKLSYVEQKAIESRQERADARDEQSPLTGDGDVRGDSDARRAGTAFSAALQSIRILGQILKNFPGTLEASAKLALTEACYGVGLRSLAVALEHVAGNKREAIDAIIKSLREAYPDLPERTMKARAEQFLWFVTILTSYGLIKTISTSVAAPELEPTYVKALASSSGTATKLIDVALRLDVSSKFPSGLLTRVADDVEGRQLPLVILKFLVLEHFAQIEVPRAVRQRICAKLGIEYKQLTLPGGKE